MNFVDDLLVSLNKDKSNISVATFFRLIAFDVLQDGVDKALYLDSDMLIVSHINKLWDLDLGNYFAAVVKDDFPIEHLDKLGLKNYFNAGMVLCNLHKWAVNRCTDDCLNYIFEKKPEWMDQDALNFMFQENVIFLDENYNLLADLEVVIDNNAVPSKSEFIISNKNAKIIHFVGRNKPWCHWVQCIPIVKKYIEVQKESMWSDNKIITVDDITDKKYKYKHIRKEMVVSFKERQFKNAIYWGVRYLVNKAKFLLNF